MLKRFKNEAKFDTVPVSTWVVSRPEDRIANSLVAPANTQATRELQDIFGAKLFPHPKSTQLVTSLASQCLSDESDIVLDFFSGSATTAHAILARNAVNGCNARFILVQLPELCESGSEAAKAGFANIADIGKERIRRIGKRMLEGKNHEQWNRDIAFRVMQIDTSNMADIYYAPDALDKSNLDLFIDNIKPGRTADDLLFQVMLDWGVDIGLPVSSQKICGLKVFLVDGNAMAACFDAGGGIDEPFVKELAKLQPLRVVFRDAGFKNSSVKINVEQIFKLLSPATEVKHI